MLCSSCQKREASSHFISIGGVKKAANLCEACFELATRALGATDRNARCDYCGGQHCSGGTDFLALIAGIKKTQHLCVPCSTEYNRFIQEHMLNEDPNLSPQEQIADLRKLKDTVDVHMKEWASKKSSQ